MPRPKLIDDTKLLELLKTGVTDTLAKDSFGVSREAIRQHRKEFEKEGLLPPRAGLVIVKRGRGLKTPSVLIAPIKPELSFDSAIDIMLTAFERAKDYPALKEELEKYKRGYYNLIEAAKREEIEEAKRKDHAHRFKLAQQQGDIRGMQ